MLGYILHVMFTKKKWQFKTRGSGEPVSLT